MRGQLKLPTLVELNQSSAQRKVFCLHTGGGGVNFYSDIANKLASEAQFFGLEDPLIYDDFEYGSIPELAEHHVDTIKAIQKEGPYTLFGYCSGGPIALEVACQLALNGDQIDRVVFFGSKLDAVVMGLTEVKENFLFLKKYLSNKYNIDLDGLDWDGFESRSLDFVVDAIIEHLICQQVEGVDKQQQWIPLAIKSLYFIHHAAKKYSPSLADFDIDLFDRYLDNDMKKAVLPWCDWDNLTTGKLKFIAAPALIGGHNDILSQPYLDNTVRQLNEVTFGN